MENGYEWGDEHEDDKVRLLHDACNDKGMHNTKESNTATNKSMSSEGRCKCMVIRKAQINARGDLVPQNGNEHKKLDDQN